MAGYLDKISRETGTITTGNKQLGASGQYEFVCAVRSSDIVPAAGTYYWAAQWGVTNMVRVGFASASMSANLWNGSTSISRGVSYPSSPVDDTDYWFSVRLDCNNSGNTWMSVGQSTDSVDSSPSAVSFTVGSANQGSADGFTAGNPNVPLALGHRASPSALDGWAGRFYYVAFWGGGFANTRSESATGTLMAELDFRSIDWSDLDSGHTDPQSNTWTATGAEGTDWQYVAGIAVPSLSVTITA